MTSAAAVETILARLARPAGRWEPVGRASGGVQAGTVTGGNSFHAELATAQVLKSRQAHQRSVHFVTFQGTLPHLGDTTVRFGYIYAIEHTDNGCRIIGEAGGGGDPPTRSRPWVNLAGGHANDHFWAGGEIERAGADIARVQLRFADGHVVEDDPTSDIALFIVNAPVQTPATVVLLDRGGETIAEHPGFPDI
jgi:hypothetical protein